MIHIITGEIDTGKTCRMLSIYRRIRMGDGFILPKIYDHGENVGQQIIRLSSGEGIPFSYRISHMPEKFDGTVFYGGYSFSSEGFSFANRIISESLRTGQTPVFMDEIGPLELMEKGFAHILRESLAKSKEMYIAVRSPCLDDIVNKFEIKAFNLISNGNPNL